jgi:hypothetical protein
MAKHIACWIIKATDTHSEYVTLTSIPQQQWILGGASAFHTYTYIYTASVLETLCSYWVAG